ncbi:MAG TPA: biotin carboxylase N-terminal domain-containing protein [Vicinamibacteria bacterium]|nr:biotin carboxylase N-terminal domain-containing protein [Vicinamibacteria bacterium]
MKRLLIANRGEIARRILRTARARAHRVAVISTAEDRDALVRREADEVLEVGSFLDGEAIVAAGRRFRADLLHPGYGFLSENAHFAELTEAAGIAFVGPRPETMKLLGDKERAKELARTLGVPTLEALGSRELSGLSAQELEKALQGKGLAPPYLVKAAGGGGGRGMRVVGNLSDLPVALERASEEALSGFADPTVFVERYLASPRHVEIQILGDGEGGGIFLGERECSMQRRYQKVIEEAPSPVVDSRLREAMGNAALALVRESRYRGAGTVEFLLDAEGRFYFLEVNTRLQVEHPVTEEVYGIDLVAAQLDIALGALGALGEWPSAGPSRQPERWAIEARVLAEDPRSGFLPTPGPVLRYREPRGPGLRVESGVAEGSRIHAGFDSLIAKVIASGESRREAIDRLAAALATMVVHGPRTNLSFLQAALRHPDFLAGRISTDWIGSHLEELNRSLLSQEAPELERRLSTAGFRERLAFVLRGESSSSESDPDARFLEIGNDYARVGSRYEERALRLDFDRSSGELRISGLDLPEVRAVGSVVSPKEMALTVLGDTLVLEDPRARVHRRLHHIPAEGEVRAPMAGKVLEVKVSAGDLVEEGAVLAVVESMKMQIEVKAPLGGRVEKVLVKEGEVLDGPELLAVIDG